MATRELDCASSEPAMTEVRPTRQIVRATGIVGAASLINMAVSALRMKLVAILLGAEGVGRIGILVSLMNTAAAAAAWGISNSGARAIASASSEEESAVARRALFGASVVLGALGGIVIVAVSAELARWLFKDASDGGAIAWTGLGVALSVVALAQNGFLTGCKRVGDLARVSAASAVITTIVTVPVLIALREKGILPYVLLGPVVTAAVGAYFVLRVPRAAGRPNLRSLTAQWRGMALLGTSLTAASFAVLGGQFAMRVVVNHALGAHALGLFQATFAISASYVGLALGALSTDYYPRLVPHVGEPATLRHLVNGQVQVSVLVAAPLIVLAIGFAPWLIALMYAPSFRPAAEMLGWQMLGDLVKIAGWPLSFVLLASGRGAMFALNEAVTIALGVAMTALLLPRFGLAGAGMAYLAMNCVYLLSLTWLVRPYAGEIWEGRTVLWWFLSACAATLTLAVSKAGAAAGMLLAFVASAALALLAVRHLRQPVAPVAGALMRMGAGKARRRESGPVDRA